MGTNSPEAFLTFKRIYFRYISGTTCLSLSRLSNIYQPTSCKKTGLKNGGASKSVCAPADKTAHDDVSEESYIIPAHRRA